MSNNGEPSTIAALPSITDPRLIKLHAYLEAKRGTREFSARSDIDPLDFAYILGNVVLVEVLDPPLRFRYRLVGSLLSGKTGYDLTGKFVDDHPDAEYRAYMLARYAETVRLRRPTGGNYDLFMDRKPKRYQGLRVPLAEDGKTIDMIIAAVIIGTPP